MTSVLIVNVPGLQIVSLGNGMAYEVKRLPDGASFLLQGDDAALFRAECIDQDVTSVNSAISLMGYDQLFEMEFAP